MKSVKQIRLLLRLISIVQQTREREITLRSREGQNAQLSDREARDEMLV